MDLVIKINTDNAAFVDNPSEIEKVLAQVPSFDTFDHTPRGSLMDTNGNKVGYWRWT